MLGRIHTTLKNVPTGPARARATYRPVMELPVTDAAQPIIPLGLRLTSAASLYSATSKRHGEIYQRDSRTEQRSRNQIVVAPTDICADLGVVSSAVKGRRGVMNRDKKMRSIALAPANCIRFFFIFLFLIYNPLFLDVLAVQISVKKLTEIASSGTARPSFTRPHPNDTGKHIHWPRKRTCGAEIGGCAFAGG